MSFEYVIKAYGVLACLGRRVEVDGRPGIIAKDCGGHIGVNFDEDKPGFISYCHPTWRVKYLEIGTIRPTTKSQQRYKRFLEYGDGFNSFIDYCRWDAGKDRTWNGGTDREYLINNSFSDSMGCY